MYFLFYKWYQNKLRIWNWEIENNWGRTEQASYSLMHDMSQLDIAIGNW